MHAYKGSKEHWCKLEQYVATFHMGMPAIVTVPTCTKSRNIACIYNRNHEHDV